MTGPRLRVCYVVAYFHPFASGAERQALAQGAELARRGHSVRVVTQAVPGSGLPRVDEVRGVVVHRCIDSIRRGPLFGVSFVAGVVRALRRLRGEYDLVHTHQALWEAVATGVARSVDRRPDARPAGQLGLLRRGRGAGDGPADPPCSAGSILRNSAFAAISADIERQWRGARRPARSDHQDRQRRRHRTASDPGPSAVESTLPPTAPRPLHGAAAPAEEPGRADRRLGRGRPPDRRPSAPARRRPRPRPARGRGRGRSASADRSTSSAPVEDPAEYLRAADLFVLPSVAEGMSNSLLEAMATGLPCVASEIGGNTDLLGDDRGRLVRPDDPGGWAEAILGLLDDPLAAASLGVPRSTRSSGATPCRSWSTGTKSSTDRSWDRRPRSARGGRGGRRRSCRRRR